MQTDSFSDHVIAAVRIFGPTLGDEFDVRDLPIGTYRRIVAAFLAENPDYALDAINELGSKHAASIVAELLSDDNTGDELHEFRNLLRTHLVTSEAIESMVFTEFERQWQHVYDERHEAVGA